MNFQQIVEHFSQISAINKIKKPKVCRFSTIARNYSFRNENPSHFTENWQYFECCSC